MQSTLAMPVDERGVDRVSYLGGTDGVASLSSEHVGDRVDDGADHGCAHRRGADQTTTAKLLYSTLSQPSLMRRSTIGVIHTSAD
ncbi:hypothetical protein [Hydrogenophaga sp.]|uniref:hypothetical protein n=1 Tax=Hydrogenophaga sp. TaxID=1904254 RepID=UPI0025B91C14|nr:hypothetical protein [Hydrogenophaga sp.]